MPVAYPLNLRTLTRDTKSRSQPAAFGLSQPRRGFGYVEASGTDTPVFWDVQFCFTRAEAVRFRLWFTFDLARGTQSFTIPVDTEFGLQTYELQFLPDTLLPVKQTGEVFMYSATVMARAELFPAAVLGDYAFGTAVTVPSPQYLYVGSAYTLSLSTYWPAGTGPFTWSVLTGTLPAGVSINSATGVLSGTPTTSGTLSGLVFRRTSALGATKDSNPVDFTVVVSDPSFASVQLLLHGDGSLADSSSFNRTPSVVGSIASATDAGAFSGQSIRFFTGSQNMATYTASFASATDLYTLDFWMRLDSSVGAGSGFSGERGQFIRLADTSLTQIITANGVVNSNTTQAFALPGAFTLTPSTYGITAVTDRCFVRIVRENSGGTTTLFFNGRYIGQSSHTTAVDTIRIGNPASTSVEMGGYLEEVRFTKSVARSTRGSANVGDVVFTVPTEPFANA